MWVVAGVLLGLVVLASLIGFHTGPHSHGVAVILGVVAAIWLLVMAASGDGAPLLWTLFGADLVISAGVGTAAVKGIRAERELEHIRPASLEGQVGTATSSLDPDGQVRVRGESWSATSLNGPIAQGASVQVIGVKGLHLEVWGESAEAPPAPAPKELFHIDPIDPLERGSDRVEQEKAGS